MPYVPDFPVALQPIASSLLSALSVREQWPATQGFVVQVADEKISVPYRVYYAPEILRSTIDSVSGDEQALVLSLGTRHWDGLLREECLRRLIHHDRPWMAPFVVQLVGEYVLEIIQFIVDALPGMNCEALAAFARQNPTFMATTRRRVVSYWDCYYRQRYPQFIEYPGAQALRTIEGVA